MLHTGATANYGKPKYEHKETTKIPWTCEDSLDLPTADWEIEWIYNVASYPDGKMKIRLWGSEAEAMKAVIIDLDLQNQVPIFHWAGGEFEMYLREWSYSSALHGYDYLTIAWDLVVKDA